MDYKELYENALGRAKAACGTGAYDDATIEFLFPEVTESDDERIRKSLVKHFTDYESSTFDGITSTEVLGWLEKQKDREDSSIKECVETLPKDAVFAIMRKLHDLYAALPMGSKEERLTDEITSDVYHLLDYNTSSKTDLVEEPYSKKKPSMRFTLHMYEDNPNSLYLSHFPIDEMSKIIAKTAMDAIESAAKTLGVNQIFVRVKNDANVTSRYYNLGFEYCDTEGEYKWLYK